MMERIDCLIRHPAFRAALAEIEAAERERIFCGHGLEHLLAVARLMALSDPQTDRELLYAAALLHDIGRAAEYRGEGSHETASAALAAPILAGCGFTPEESQQILTAIGEHRSGHPAPRSPLGELLFHADKESRPCYLCGASPQCNWPDWKKNHTLTR